MRAGGCSAAQRIDSARVAKGTAADTHSPLPFWAEREAEVFVASSRGIKVVGLPRARAPDRLLASSFPRIAPRRLTRWSCAYRAPSQRALTRRLHHGPFNSASSRSSSAGGPRVAEEGGLRSPKPRVHASEREGSGGRPLGVAGDGAESAGGGWVLLPGTVRRERWLRRERSWDAARRHGGGRLAGEEEGKCRGKLLVPLLLRAREVTYRRRARQDADIALGGEGGVSLMATPRK